MTSLTAGVVAVQGAARAHVDAFERLGERAGMPIEAVAVRTPGRLADCDVVALPGGESTAISRLIERQGLASELRAHVAAGKPLLATCAGMIVAASDPGDDRVGGLGLLDVAIERNAFGRQRDSFEVPLALAGLDRPFPAVFIRAPAVTDAGGATVLATHDGRPVAVRSGPVLATAFHPELTDDVRVHRLALEAA